jgi:hypothetical protein
MYPLDNLIADFPSCLQCYVETEPFTAEYQQYIATVELRKQLGTVEQAISDASFLSSLYATLVGFFGLVRIGLLPLEEFKQALSTHKNSIASLGGRKLGAEPSVTGAELCELIMQLNLTKKKEKKSPKDNPKLVSGTKTLHLLLPDLMAPVDRQYWGAFLFRYYNSGYEAGADELETFRIAFTTSHTIAEKVAPEKYVQTDSRHTTPTKVIDNAVIGFVRRSRAQFKATAENGFQVPKK